MAALLSCYILIMTAVVFVNKSVDASDNNKKNPLIMRGKISAYLPAHKERNSITRDIITILSTLEKAGPIRLNLLFDDNFIDTVSEIVLGQKTYFHGMMLYGYNGSMLSLNQLLNSAAGTTLLIILCKSQRLIRILEKTRDERLDRSKAIWLFIVEEQVEALEKMIIALEKLIPEGTRVTLLNKESSSTSRVYSSQVDQKGIVRFLDSGMFNGNAGYHRFRLLDLLVPDLDRHYMDMKGRTLKVGALDYWPFFKLGRKLDDDSYEAEAGFDASVLKALSMALNFTYRVKVPGDLAFGSVLPNGTATGLIGLVERREANFAICSLGITAIRKIAVDFTFSYFRYIFITVSRAPVRKNRAFAVFTPFTPEVWLYIFSSLLITGSTLAVLSKVSDNYFYAKLSKWLVDVFTFSVFRSLVLQGNLFEPKIIPLRLIFISWYFFVLIVVALYSGTLTALLAIPAFEKGIDSLNDLPKAIKEGYLVTLGKGSSIEYLLRDADSGIYKEIWSLVSKQDPSQTFFRGGGAGDMLPRLLEEKLIILTTRENVEIRAKEFGRRNFHFGRDAFFPVGIGIACSFGAPFSNVFNKLLQKMFEGGLVNKWRDDEARRIPDKMLVEEEKKLSAVKLNHLQAAFFIVVLGGLVSGLGLVAEMMFHYLFK